MLGLISVTGVHTSLLVLLQLIRAKLAWPEIPPFFLSCPRVYCTTDRISFFQGTFAGMSFHLVG